MFGWLVELLLHLTERDLYLSHQAFVRRLKIIVGEPALLFLQRFLKMGIGEAADHQIPGLGRREINGIAVGNALFSDIDGIFFRPDIHEDSSSVFQAKRCRT